MMFQFRPASSFTDRHGMFVALVGNTNSGKTFSALRLARGIAGPGGRVAVLDTEGGRTLHLKRDFDFDISVMEPPFRPYRFTDAARDAEEAGYGALLIDSFSQEWAGSGGVLEWQAEELSAMVERARSRAREKGWSFDEVRTREASKMASWIQPKMAHKAMVNSFLQRRIPIIFSIRGEETIKPGEKAGEKPTKIFKMICNQSFPFEVTVSFRLAADRKGYIDLSDPSSWKMEGAHRSIFKNGDQLAETHGEHLAAWACGQQTIERNAAPSAQGATGGADSGPPASADHVGSEFGLPPMGDDGVTPLDLDAIRKRYEGYCAAKDRAGLKGWIGALTAEAQAYVRRLMAEDRAGTSVDTEY